MTLRDRIRDCLGLDVLPTYAHFNSAMTQLHAQNVEILARMERLEALVSRPQVTRSIIASASDWETVQLMAMQALERNPEKEN